tara:strand:- start:46 stop:381 length:336 start_codon:yes stop_codon:yes gene_type:complete
MSNIDKNNFYVCIKPTVHKGEDSIKIDICDESEPNKYHVSESEKCYEDMVKISNHLKVGMNTWSPKNASGFIPSISLNKYGKAFMMLSNGNVGKAKQPTQSLSITDVLAIN